MPKTFTTANFSTQFLNHVEHYVSIYVVCQHNFSTYSEDTQRPEQFSAFFPCSSWPRESSGLSPVPELESWPGQVRVKVAGTMGISLSTFFFILWLSHHYSQL